jgi:glycosyltransferase involved in cell wall biosynthesis
MALSLALVAEGNAETTDCWSGSAKAFVSALRRNGARVDVFDVEPRSWRRALAAGVSVRLNRRHWRQRYELGAPSFALKSSTASAAIGRMQRRGAAYDAIIQIGGTLLVAEHARGATPYIVYSDSNIRHALRGAPYSGASSLAPAEVPGVIRREQRVYDASHRLWTMSRALGESYVRDFAQPPEKVLSVYAGANNVPEPPSYVAPREPLILFIGKDHERKGSRQLLDAFEAVRAHIPAAELHIVGAVPPGSDRPGVTAHGFVSRHTPDGARALDTLFRRAAVFCLPSHYEPFGVAFVEAMLAGLPCIGTTKWAMPEIIVDGQTGWLVRPGDPRDLAASLITALEDLPEAARRGMNGRRRALELFTWDRVAERALADLDRFPARAAAQTSSHRHIELPGYPI